MCEHLPYPSITVREVHRILKKNPRQHLCRSVPWTTICIGVGSHAGQAASHGEQTTCITLFKELNRDLSFHSKSGILR